ncbi:MAG: hypothetical protein M3M95_06470, partial [Pseudomonadota bacterium]|nr:hypothetical protein [Pseudomonadota bacterium]
MLQTAQIAAVRAVLAAAPDGALRTLEAALRADAGGSRAMLVRDLIETELTERLARDGVFAPVLAVCGPPRHAAGIQLFPPWAPARLWAVLKRVASEETQSVLAGVAPELAASVQNRLCLRAAAGLRTGEPGFAAAMDGLEPSAVSQLALALELAPLTRAALEEMPAWFARATGAHVAAMRLAYKDAARLGEGAGPLLMEMLLAALDEPWRVLQLVAWVMDRPDERFVADSELAGLVRRVIEAVEVEVAAVKAVDFSRGPSAGLEAARAVEAGLAGVAAAERALTLKRGPWSDQVRKQRAALSGAAEARLREAEALVNALLPRPPMKIAGRSFGADSRFETAPEPEVMLQGGALMTFLSETRAAAEGGG